MSHVKSSATGGVENIDIDSDIGGLLLVFLCEFDLFGNKELQGSEWLLHEELLLQYLNRLSRLTSQV